MAGETVLVTGGCGFVGYHVVAALKQDGTWPAIHVISRNPTFNLQDSVSYHTCDLTSKDQVRNILKLLHPTLIIHCASPMAEHNDFPASFFIQTNLGGTKNLLEAAFEIGGVKALVYTSSSTVHIGKEFTNRTEKSPMFIESTQTQNFYSKSKALADQFVLDFNGRGSIQTCCLRIAAVYGERDTQIIPGALKVLREQKHTTQIGDGKAVQDLTSVENVAKAHMLAAHKLCQPKSSIAGEAFLITDQDPMNFWDFGRIVWKAAGDKTPRSEYRVLPTWFALALASTIEWLFWIFTLGTKRPTSIRRHRFEYLCLDQTFCIDKAHEMLGYEPDKNRMKSIHRGVAWEMKKHCIEQKKVD